MRKVLLVSAVLVFVLVQVKAQKVVVADNCDSAKEWSSSQMSSLGIDKVDFKEGTGALKTEGEGPFRYRKVFSTPVNTGVEANAGFLGFWLYVSEVEDFQTNPGQLVISSSGKMELNALQWKLNNLNLKKGWNKVALDLSAASVKGGDFDPANLNYFNMLQKTATPVLFKIDNIKFAKSLKDL